MKKHTVFAAAILFASLGLSIGSANASGANAGGPPYANDCQTYNTCLPSLNGNGNGNATGRPDAGSVGNADGKNPPGQVKKLDGALEYPANDGDSGYECDSNNGVGKGNPAHSYCEGWS